MPVLIDLSESDHIMLGEIDEDDLDQFGVHGDSGWPRFAGIRQIGDTRSHTAMALFMIRTNKPGYVRLTLHFLHKDRKHDGLGIIELKDAIVGKVVSEAGRWHADLALQSDDALLLVTHRSGIAYIDAIEAAFFDAPPGE